MEVIALVLILVILVEVSSECQHIDRPCGASSSIITSAGTISTNKPSKELEVKGRRREDVGMNFQRLQQKHREIITYSSKYEHENTLIITITTLVLVVLAVVLVLLSALILVVPVIVVVQYTGNL